MGVLGVLGPYEGWLELEDCLRDDDGELGIAEVDSLPKSSLLRRLLNVRLLSSKEEGKR